MNKTEYVLTGLIAGTIILLVPFILFWWPAAALRIFNILPLSESMIMITAFTGLFAGLIVNVLWLKKIISRVYQLKMPLLILLYLFCSVMAVACFMGLPVGNLVLGMLAGLYIGRKYHYRESNGFVRALTRVSLFTASITAVEAFATGLLVIREKHVTDAVNKLAKIQLFSDNQYQEVLIIMALCAILWGLQYIITRLASKQAFSH